MSFDFLDTHYNGYLVVSVVDRGAKHRAPIVRFGVTTTNQAAQDWVDLGTDGSSNSPMTWAAPPARSELTVTQSQA